MNKPKREAAARRNAYAVARYLDKNPDVILYYIAKEFGKSTTWASKYKRLAREYGYSADKTCPLCGRS